MTTNNISRDKKQKFSNFSCFLFVIFFLTGYTEESFGHNEEYVGKQNTMTTARPLPSVVSRFLFSQPAALKTVTEREQRSQLLPLA